MAKQTYSTEFAIGTEMVINIHDGTDDYDLRGIDVSSVRLVEPGYERIDASDRGILLPGVRGDAQAGSLALNLHTVKEYPGLRNFLTARPAAPNAGKVKEFTINFYQRYGQGAPHGLLMACTKCEYNPQPQHQPGANAPSTTQIEFVIKGTVTPSDVSNTPDVPPA